MENTNQYDSALLELTVRYTREISRPGLPCREECIADGYLDWQIPVEQSALVLVDCWSDFVLESFTERSEEIIRERIAPTLDMCRQAGMAVIHAPSPGWAENYPKYLAYPDEKDAAVKSAERPQMDWPPEEFVSREGNYSVYKVPRLGTEPVFLEWAGKNPVESLRINPALEPRQNDKVIVTGDQLHRYCQSKGILHLFYVGFATNICITFRDYGTRAMSELGYNVILLRDCTTGIEIPSTLPNMDMTETAIRNLEIKTAVSGTCESLRQACQGVIACENRP